ncbi:MAG: hypothetical protein LBD34_00870 [Puniceicoccales bacterium]|jgi:hypothetical protein|nr:hypothetical protein [Puniceicoccales bacterium]
MWKDFATGESGNNLLDLLCKVRGRDFYDVCREAANWLSYGENFYDFDAVKKTNMLETERKDKMPKYHPFHDLKDGNFSDLLQLAHSMEVAIAGEGR